jgi:hypothetical protein
VTKVPLTLSVIALHEGTLHSVSAEEGIRRDVLALELKAHHDILTCWIVSICRAKKA